MTIDEINIDQAILSKYQDSVYRNIIEILLKNYKKVFLKVYEKYNIRFNEIYKKDMFILKFYYNFIRMFEKDIKNILEILEKFTTDTRNRGTKKKINIDQELEFKNSLINARFFFVETEKELRAKIKLDKKGKNEKKPYLSMVKSEIFNQIESELFSDAGYFLDEAEEKLLMSDPFKKNYNELQLIYFLHNYESGNNKPQKEKKKKIIDTIRIIKPDYKILSANSSDSYYQTTRKYFKAKKDYELYIKQINQKILTELRGLT
jgi:hypothetical protein